MKHLVDLYKDISSAELSDILRNAAYIKEFPKDYSRAAEGKIMATLFIEPSTRTHNSFKSAMMRLGGNVIGIDDASATSISKGETLRDTIMMFGAYSDLIVMRHRQPGIAAEASRYCPVPFINAGDGGNLHPTQTLTDLVTLSIERRLDNLKIGICGDLKYGRTVHSLVKSLSKFTGNRFVYISSKTLSIPDKYKGYAQYEEYGKLDKDVISELDVLYMTRIQRERLGEGEMEDRGKFILTQELMKAGKPDLAVLHPLPRNEEISVDVDSDPRALYFKQAECGVYARMALILKMIIEN